MTDAAGVQNVPQTPQGQHFAWHNPQRLYADEKPSVPSHPSHLVHVNLGFIGMFTFAVVIGITIYYVRERRRYNKVVEEELICSGSGTDSMESGSEDPEDVSPVRRR